MWSTSAFIQANLIDDTNIKIIIGLLCDLKVALRRLKSSKVTLSHLKSSQVALNHYLILSERLKSFPSYYFSSFLFEFWECMIPHKVCSNLCISHSSTPPPRQKKKFHSDLLRPINSFSSLLIETLTLGNLMVAGRGSNVAVTGPKSRSRVQCRGRGKWFGVRGNWVKTTDMKKI